MPPTTSSTRAPRNRAAVLRGAAYVGAIVLGVIAVWLIVTGTSLKATRIGALAGFWGLLLGALAAFGTRHAHAANAEQSTAADQGLGLQRRGTELDRIDDAAARREFEYRLEHLLRREIQAAVNREVGSLRTEVATLRTELLEKVGGQLRLERIETTRVIGSDIEALQREIDQLKAVREESTPRLAGQIVDMTPVPPTPVSSMPITQPRAAQQPPPPPAPAPVRQAPAVQPPPPPRAPAPQPPQAPPPAVPTPAPAPAPPPPRPAEPFLARDEFAGLPRLSPFTDFEPDPIEPPVSYSGRRRAEEAGGPGGGEAGGGRRRRDTDDGHDVLARILQRESTR